MKRSKPKQREALERLQSEYPYGSPHFIPMALEEIVLHSNKNHDYAKGGRPLGNFERTAAIMQLYHGFPWASPVGSAVVQMLKQLDAFLWGHAKQIQAVVEGADSRLMDIGVFTKIIRCLLKDQG